MYPSSKHGQNLNNLGRVNTGLRQATGYKGLVSRAANDKESGLNIADRPVT